MNNNKLYENTSFQHILKITESLILEKGCSSTTLKDIIDNSGLSKGAIYHYVSSKNELYGLILQSKIEKINESFNEQIKLAAASKDTNGPFHLISQFFYENQKSGDAGNLIFVYLLSQNDVKVKAILENIYALSRNVGEKWIKSGQENGVIPTELDAGKFTDLLMTFSYGLRVKQMISPKDKDTKQLELKDINKLIMKALS